ncbi:MAG: 30S ribosome-binding factor RbfA [Alphaproteobacteria bacterium]|nr:30S ribosome-binding factor RbfA [Alphaproteobacteria bacterium]TAD91875.1 MAG: 30S ribosome-binding factor RbfA [Alphaproteobacteria bacterium]
MTRSRGGPPSQRQLRVGEAVRHALVAVLARGEVRDPGLEALGHGTLVTVSEVRMSPDLKHATCFVTPLGGGDATELVRALKRVAPWLRAEVARAVTLKFAPDLHFQPDTSFDDAARLDQLITQVTDGAS